MLKSGNTQLIILAKLSLRLPTLLPGLYHWKNILLVVLLVLFHEPKIPSQSILSELGLVERYIKCIKKALIQ